MQVWGRDWCASQTGKVVKVKVLSFKGLASRSDLKSCAWDSNGPDEALTEERAGQALSCEIPHTSESRRSQFLRKATFCQSLSETGRISAQSKTLYMLGSTLHGNWESPRLPGTPGCIGKSKDVSQ